MEDAFTITLSEGTLSTDLDTLQAELRELDGIADVGSMEALSVSPQEVMLWVQTAAGVIGVATAVVPLLEKIRGLFRKKSVRGAQVTLGDGTVIKFDDVTADELERLLQAARNDN
jgi:hypothetical protein